MKLHNPKKIWYNSIVITENKGDKMKTKDILRIERLKRNLTQEDVAKILNIARASYAQYETGKNTPTTESIIKLAELYRVSTDYLLGLNFTEVLKTGYLQGKEDGEETAEQIIANLEKPKRVRKKRTT